MNPLAESLVRRKSAPCEGRPALSDAELAPLLAALPDWTREGDTLVREFRFANHYETQAFANVVMWLSHREDHHPDLAVGYNRIRVAYSTHSVGGLSDNDFICAAKLDLLHAL